MANAQSSKREPLITMGDTNGIVYVFAGNLGTFILVAATLIGFGWPTDLVFFRVMPGMAMGLMVSGLYYTWMAMRLAKKENRTDVTALPSGLSTPVAFLYLFGIIAPLQFGLGLPPEEVWKAAMAACFLGGVIEACGAFMGPIIKKYLPRVAMLGTLAGIAILWIATKGLFEIYSLPVLGMPVLIIAILGLIGGYKLPKKIPPLVVSLVVGIALALAMGEAKIVLDGVGKFYAPKASISSIITGFKYIMPYLNVIIPIEIYNFIETMDNVESAQAAGDNYNVGEAQFADGVATMIGALFGGVCPNTVWMGHPGLKQSGCRIGYAWVSGILFFLTAIFGFFALLYNLIPTVIVAIVFLWCALTITAQAFVDTPRRHAAAIGIAMLPHIANYAYTQISSTLMSVGVFAITPEVSQSLIDNGIIWKGIEALNYGAVLSGMMWAAIIAFVIDRNLKAAGNISFIAAAFTFFGILHSPLLGINAGPVGITIGYVSVAVICYLVDMFKDKLDVPVRYDYV
jgi:AGZA family xanthine/uracil permease-like MFS transporter